MIIVGITILLNVERNQIGTFNFDSTALKVDCDMQPDMADGLADVGKRLYGVETRRPLQDGIDFAVGQRRQPGKNNLRIMEKGIEE